MVPYLFGQEKKNPQKNHDTYLDGFCSFKGLLRRNADFSLPKDLLNEVGDVSPSDGYMFDAATDHIAFSLCTKQFIPQ